MRSFLLSLPGPLQALLIVCLIIGLAFTTALCCSLFFDAHELAASIDLISSVYQVLGTIYAILLTFTLWGVWQNFTNAETSVENEAYALLDLVHVLESSVSWEKSNIRKVALEYAKIVVEQEWPMLKTLTSQAINLNERINSPAIPVMLAVQNIPTSTQRDCMLFEQVLNLLNKWLDARRSRLLIARGNSAKALWPLLLTGAFVLFTFHGLFVAKTFGIWAMLLFGTSLVISVTYYLIFSLDCPFCGSLSVDAEPFELAINVLNQPNIRKNTI